MYLHSMILIVNVCSTPFDDGVSSMYGEGTKNESHSSNTASEARSLAYL